MSKYYHLACKTCEVSLNLGKKLAIGEALILQGSYSELGNLWMSDHRAWLVVQEFLQRHENHELLFASDEAFPQVQYYDSADADQLLGSTGQ